VKPPPPDPIHPLLLPILKVLDVFNPLPDITPSFLTYNKEDADALSTFNP